MITSRQHPLIKLVRSLHSPKSRQESGCFVVEGRNGCEAALAAGWPLREILAEVGDEVWHERARQAGIPVFEADAEILAYASDSTSSPGVLAVAELPPVKPLEFKSGATLVIDGVGDPGNVGTLIRAADAAGCAGVIVTTGSAGPWAPKVVRAAAGSLFRMVPQRAEAALVAQVLQERKIPVVIAAAHDGQNAFTMARPSDCAIIVGHETRGVSAELQSAATFNITIPVFGGAESLNAAMAGTVLLYAWRAGQPSS